jgi:hypothetical protein
VRLKPWLAADHKSGTKVIATSVKLYLENPSRKREVESSKTSRTFEESMFSMFDNGKDYPQLKRNLQVGFEDIEN